MEACTQISADLHQRHHLALAPKRVWDVLQRLRPTTDLAKMYLKAKAYRLVKRFVKKAEPGEILDVLSRPGMNVIEAAKTASQSSGFFLSVNVDSCGAVKMGVASGTAPVAALPEAVEDIFAGSVGGFDEGPESQDEGPATQALDGQTVDAQDASGNGHVQDALSRARAKLAAVRREHVGHTVHQAVKRLQDTHE